MSRMGLGRVITRPRTCSGGLESSNWLQRDRFEQILSIWSGGNTEHEQFAVNARRPPDWIGHAHLADQLPDLCARLP
jgi:hypothetical protein